VASGLAALLVSVGLGDEALVENKFGLKVLCSY